jgi:restriction system protein
MAVWLVRAGRNGERESFALEENLAVIGFDELPDLAQVHTRDELTNIFLHTYSGKTTASVRNYVSQVWAFIQKIQVNDLIVLPLKTRSAIAIGKAIGLYQYRPDLPEDAKHTRPVKWLRTDLPRSAFDQDLLYSLGAFSTVCQIQRNNAEQRIKALIEQNIPIIKNSESKVNEHEESIEDTTATLDLSIFARDQIREYISQKFKGHDFANLVNELLKAKGYKTLIVPPGPDGGMDILAGSGPMGFDHPKICIQVKSSEDPLDVKILRELQGVLKNFGAEQGLLVSWGGFKSTVIKEAQRIFFEIRLWDSGDILDALFENYDQLPKDLQAEIPLKHIWTLVLEG